MYDFHLWLACFFNVHQDGVQIHNDKDIEVFGKDFIDIALKTGQNVGKSKRHDLVLEMAVSGTKSSFPFVNL